MSAESRATCVSWVHTVVMRERNEVAPSRRTSRELEASFLANAETTAFRFSGTNSPSLTQLGGGADSPLPDDMFNKLKLLQLNFNTRELNECAFVFKNTLYKE